MKSISHVGKMTRFLLDTKTIAIMIALNSGGQSQPLGNKLTRTSASITRTAVWKPDNSGLEEVYHSKARLYDSC
jgi:hypothetical protein